MYLVGITIILVLETADAVLYGVGLQKTANVTYCILVAFQFVCIGFLGFSLFRMTSVIKEYHLMTID